LVEGFNDLYCDVVSLKLFYGVLFLQLCLCACALIAEVSCDIGHRQHFNTFYFMVHVRWERLRRLKVQVSDTAVSYPAARR
jgi:hypothetical protein